MSNPPGNRVARVGIIAWLVCVLAIDACILLFSPDRGSGTDGLFLIMLGLFGGGIALLFAILALLPAQARVPGIICHAIDRRGKFFRIRRCRAL